jgi:1,4-alpha-glucan branching enzyme/maltooligosyltrehalose trehalohydrolase
MPFGAQITTAGTVRFQLWAPAAERVSLQLETPSGSESLDMRREAQGWFGLETRRAVPGMHYRFRCDQGPAVPDPASRYQPQDVHGASEIIDPAAWQWRDRGWPGRPWEEAIFYELHVGTFSPEGTFAGVAERLDVLAEMGITAVELMPVADFPGRRDWGYNGVLPFAPDSRYGRPEDLKALVEAAHQRGMMIFLDVVYNHFGPEGNYLSLYAPAFFSRKPGSPWGDTLNFDGPDSLWVRRFFIHNALYWLEEYHFDGLRLDAVHAIHDESVPDILEELAQAVHHGPGKTRHIHLVLENDHNAARYLRRDATGRPLAYTAQWNDDFHHVLHVLATGERGGYYQDYLPSPIHYLGRCLTQGFAYQGEESPYRHDARGEPSAGLPPGAFVNFIQNHDQIGNRPRGERLTRLVAEPMVKAVTAILLLAPPPPLLFMGQEWGCTDPFPFFCDFGEDLIQPVREGRRRELAAMLGGEPDAVDTFDPFADETFNLARLRWSDRDEPGHAAWLEYHAGLLALRRREIVPRLRCGSVATEYLCLGTAALKVWWRFADGACLTLYTNLGAEAVSAMADGGRLLFATSVDRLQGVLPPCSAAWYLTEGQAHGG